MVPLILSAANSPGASWKEMVPLILSALHTIQPSLQITFTNNTSVLQIHNHSQCHPPLMTKDKTSNSIYIHTILDTINQFSQGFRPIINTTPRSHVSLDVLFSIKRTLSFLLPLIFNSKNFPVYNTQTIPPTIQLPPFR